MPAKIFIVPKRVEKRLYTFPLPIQKRILKNFETIQANPLVGIKLHGELSGYYKKRVGDYRIVYCFITAENTVEVVKIEHRQGVYK